MNYNAIATQLDQASLNAQAVSQISLEHAIKLDEAYAIQSISISRRYERGEKKTGLKLGFTSKAKMEQMGVHDLIWGKLTDKMERTHNSDLNMSEFIHPRAEPEIAFRISKEVDKVLDNANYLDYIDGVSVAIEIIDSRYENFKFSLEDVIADNCSSAAYAVGDWHPATTNIQDIQIQLLNGDQELHIGNSNAILGNPLESLFAASRLAIANGELLAPGHTVLAGAATPAVYIQAGQKIIAKAIGLGEVAIQVN